MERVKSSFATSSTGERILNVTESLQLMTDMNMISVFGDLARNQGVALGPRAEFDSVSQSAYSRDIPDADLTSLASAAPKHLCTQEKVRFMELAVASLPTQSRTQSCFDAVNKQTTPTDYQAGEAQVQPVWSNPRFVTQKDKEATYTLIDIYGSSEIRKLIGDKKTKSKYVFELIAQQMEEKGFLISDRAEKAWERCAQKWRNLERSFKDYSIFSIKTRQEQERRRSQIFSMNCIPSLDRNTL
ncbi:uncharacterized protein LOC124135379 isoform X1 [Haliotis rufescens]|uniref:uncharacterized protein LOC124135379 isoform X1 n=1 Tax=Haliotis rufescens TaxID=6454 RepID=UPI001EAFA306|nr:uncharacterized protein LOC124135379 isoform X1 [Haliotis rufescens]